MAVSERFYYWQDRMSTRKGSRQSFPLQLDWDEPEDVELIKIIAMLKDKQDFSKVLKMALRIIPALMYEGNLDELFSEFAWVRLEMLEYFKELQQSQAPAPVTDGVGDFKHEFERLARLILQQGNGSNGNNGNGLKPVVGQPQKLNVPKIEAPSFEDEDEGEDLGDLLVVKKDKDAGKRATQNFLNSMMKLQG